MCRLCVPGGFGRLVGVTVVTGWVWIPGRAVLGPGQLGPVWAGGLGAALAGWPAKAQAGRVLKHIMPEMPW